MGETMTMLKVVVVLTLALLAPATFEAAQARDVQPQLSDDNIRKQIISDSISAYPGNCPCPYNSARNGSRCGARSAYSRAGGYATLCFPADVSDEMVLRYRLRAKGGNSANPRQ